ncbi:MAG: hypothetical protein ACKVWR_04430 [Acidimicrobiales bacterium]
MAERYVVLGLAHVRAPWFAEVSRWATTAAAPVEFVKCLSAEEVRARLGSGRVFSALLVEAGAGGVDRDLLDLARTAGCAPIVVDETRPGRDWLTLGAAAALPRSFDRAALMDALRSCAPSLEAVGAVGVDAAAPRNIAALRWRGRLVTVAGPGGTGASVLAAALAQSLADEPFFGGGVALADFALDDDQAMLHAAPDIVPGLSELVDAHRVGEPDADEVRALTFTVDQRGYRLLLGLRRHRDWAALRPRAAEAALEGLRRAFRVVVADADADLEGEAECGSVEVEERNLLARLTAQNADVFVLVGGPDLKGLHSLVRTLERAAAFGVDPARIVVVINHAPRGARRRAEAARALAGLTEVSLATPLAAPVCIGPRRGLDAALRDGGRLPAALGAPLAAAVRAVLDRAPDAPAAAEPRAVVPGSLGRLGGDELAS